MLEGHAGTRPYAICKRLDLLVFAPSCKTHAIVIHKIHLVPSIPGVETSIIHHITHDFPTNSYARAIRRPKQNLSLGTLHHLPIHRQGSLPP